MALHTEDIIDNGFMKIALKEAEIAAEEGEIPVGAIIVCKGRIIARTHNQTERLRDVTAHAEMLAITSAISFLGGKYLTDCCLYVTMEPCIMCSGALAWSQISRIVYGASDPNRGYSKFTPSPLHPKTIVKNGVLEEDCATIVKNFFQTKR